RGVMVGHPIQVSGGTDSNTINLWQTVAQNPVDIFAGDGSDTITIGHGVKHTVNVINAPVHIDGGEGVDTLNVDDSGDTADNTGLLTGDHLSGLGMGSTDQNQVNPEGGVFYGGVETLDVKLGAGNDHFFVQGTLPQTFVHAGPGNDEILVGNLNHSLDDILGTLTIDAEGGQSNYLRVDDSGDPDRDAATITSSSIIGFSPAAIFYGATGGAFGSIYDPTSQSFSRGIDILAGTGD